MASVQYARQTERVNLLDDVDSDGDDTKTESNGHFWPRDLANANHAETGLIDEEGKVPGCVASANKSIRMAFLRKVLGIVSFQLIMTIGICTAIYNLPDSKNLVARQ
ncbi:unnamed protein product [Caenorhabditis bovis]|uniref:Uncharacterized protein n=1 Tax=Caenorhabditis bovis TaxID=2654633 RepID=A0A8S1E7E2_9PELO|nr:unnamed protein product [Caenorhabditis bovis]